VRCCHVTPWVVLVCQFDALRGDLLIVYCHYEWQLMRGVGLHHLILILIIFVHIGRGRIDSVQAMLLVLLLSAIVLAWLATHCSKLPVWSVLSPKSWTKIYVALRTHMLLHHTLRVDLVCGRLYMAHEIGWLITWYLHVCAVLLHRSKCIYRVLSLPLRLS
jgi:hypothetical protein